MILPSFYTAGIRLLRIRGSSQHRRLRLEALRVQLMSLAPEDCSPGDALIRNFQLVWSIRIRVRILKYYLLRFQFDF